ncbi:MAG: adenine deaminase C-terminal domain-containing protein [Pararhodobacter sp.]
MPPLPASPVTVNAIGIEKPGIVRPHRRVHMVPGADWAETLAAHSLTHVAVIERHGKTGGRVAQGFLQDFGLKGGAVASSLGHDSHNIIVAGTHEGDMRLAVDAIKEAQGGIAVVLGGRLMVRASTHPTPFTEGGFTPPASAGAPAVSTRPPAAHK